MKINKCSDSREQKTSENTTTIISQGSDRWTGEVKTGQQSIRVTVNSVSGLFSRTAKIKGKSVS